MLTFKYLPKLPSAQPAQIGTYGAVIFRDLRGLRP